MSDNTAGEGSEDCLQCGQCEACIERSRLYYEEMSALHAPQTPIPAQCELVDKAALDALREAVKPDGCHNRAPCPHGTARCGMSFHDGASDEGVIYLCDIHAAKRDAAIARLLGSEIEGDSNG